MYFSKILIYQFCFDQNVFNSYSLPRYLLVTNCFQLLIVIVGFIFIVIRPRQANLVLIAYASSEGSGEPAHPRSLARTFAARSYKQWIKRNLQTENQIPGPSEWLGMRSWNLSWRKARRHKFAWRGPYNIRVWWYRFLAALQSRLNQANWFLYEVFCFGLY